MSIRRAKLLPKFCSRRLSALNLSNAEVNGISAGKIALPKSRTKCEHKRSTHPTVSPMGKNNSRNSRKSKMKFMFALRFKEAKVFEDHGRYGTAEKLYIQLINFCERNFGVDRFETGILINQLALMHFRQGELELAKPLFERALAILVKRRRKNHRHSRTVRENLADSLRVQARRDSDSN
jgi:hypothetical protein